MMKNSSEYFDPSTGELLMEHHHSSNKPDWKHPQGHQTISPFGIPHNGASHGFRSLTQIKNTSASFDSQDQDDGMVFMEESNENDNTKQCAEPWKILIADDDANVHDTTVLALSGVQIHGKPLEFLHAFSAKEAKEVAINNPDTSLILLDVVMETVDAGLKLVNVLRDELSRKNLRIVLRTGQPGYAQESMMDSFAIDGYATKSKLTRSILISMLSDVLNNEKKPDDSLN